MNIPSDMSHHIFVQYVKYCCFINPYRQLSLPEARLETAFRVDLKYVQHDLGTNFCRSNYPIKQQYKSQI